MVDHKIQEDTETEAVQKTDEPPMYQVILLNDDFTPMDFVISVLTRFFSMSTDQAERVMLEVHYKGRAVCGVYTRDVAETRVAQVNQAAREHEHPLLCVMEQA